MDSTNDKKSLFKKVKYDRYDKWLSSTTKGVRPLPFLWFIPFFVHTNSEIKGKEDRQLLFESI